MIFPAGNETGPPDLRVILPVGAHCSYTISKLTLLAGVAGLACWWACKFRAKNIGPTR